MKMRQVLHRLLNDKKTLLVALSVILVLVGVGSWYLVDSGVRKVLDYRSPYTFLIEPGFRSQPLAERLIIVLIDGLQPRDFEAMLSVRDVAHRGVAISLEGSSGLGLLPASTVLFTGAPPEISGVAANWTEDEVMIDSLWSSARRARLGTAIIGDGRWKPLFGHLVVKAAYRRPDGKVPTSDINDAILRDAISEIREGSSQLVLVSFIPQEDSPGFRTGSGRQRALRHETLANIDERLHSILEEVDLSSSAVFFVSSGSYVTGNSLLRLFEKSGDALLVAAGAGIVTPEDPGEAIQWIRGRLVDIAPTCTSLLGISMPTHSQGEVMYSLLDLPEHVMSELAISQASARSAFAHNYMNTLQRPVIEHRSLFDAFLLHNDGDYKNAAITAINIDDEIISAMANARSALIYASSLPLLAAVGIVGILLIVVTTILLERKTGDLAPAVIGVFFYFTIYFGLMLIRGTLMSSGAISSLSEFARSYQGRIMDSAGCMILTAVVIAWIVSERKDHYERGQGFIDGLISFCFVALALLVQVAVFIAGEGTGYALHLPGIDKAFKCFLCLIQLKVAGGPSPILSGLAEGVFLLLSKARSSGSDSESL